MPHRCGLQLPRGRGRDQAECLEQDPLRKPGRRQPACRHLGASPAAFTYSCHMPAKSDPAEIGDVEPLADSTARQARRVVAAYATDADECRIFLSMLGIGPRRTSPR